ncbi:MAG: UDP-N-acetylglucosamine 1-carboxyvinyltransferase [Lentihominibacter sp.]
MGKYLIRGGKSLSGEVLISGAKNAALPVLAAAVATKGENIIEACPEISDVDNMVSILEALGCRAERDGSRILVDASALTECRIPDEMMKEMRSSVFLAGSLLARCGEAVISSPGGCNIGKRPIDIHIKGLRSLGADIESTDEKIFIRGGNLRGTDIRLDYPSVGATENLMLAATAAQGTTIIDNSAREPEIKALQDYINMCGGSVSGAGTARITIEGQKKLTGCEYRMIPDRIEAGTYLLMGAATDGDVCLKGVVPEHIGPLIEIIRACGYRIFTWDDNLRICGTGAGRVKCRVDTAPYPGFPTDLQPQLTAFLTKKGDDCVVRENIFENRFRYAKQLIKMGADIEISQKEVIIKGNNILYGCDVEAEDLRGGAALVIAGLMAEGDTVLSNTKYIKRGYSRFREKIQKLGGEIREDGQ